MPRAISPLPSRDDADWKPALLVLNLPLINEFSSTPSGLEIDSLYALAQMGERSVPIFYERVHAEQQIQLAKQRAEAEAQAAVRAAARERQKNPPPWGTPGAKAYEIERIRQELAKKGRG